MKRTIIIATALLLLQIGLAVGLNLGNSRKDLASPDTSFLGLAPDAVTAIDITGPEKDRIVLQKSSAGWILPDSFNAPVNPEQIRALLERLAALKQGFAVATTAEAAKRFKVADDLFQRHVLVKEGDRLAADFYIGTSPGFRQIHARKAGSENVVAVELSTFELETGADQWLDKNMFKIKEEDIEAISFAEFTLQKKDNGWQLEGLSEGQATDVKAAGDLVTKVSGLTVATVLKPQEAVPLFAGAPALQFTVKRKGGGAAEFKLAKAAEGDSYVLKQSERDLYCKVHSLQVEGLLKANRGSLIAKEKAAEPEKTADDGK